ncbi:hypothetical protein M045_gp65 [Mycobacterium phage HINdeR]|uniref:Uncharacterized protein n=1 Tax=Mycobacterium phage HINdeR TaxID=1327770 RepID=R4JGC3_9CAUD|nr:hypothetical protein M045_gp65 [Mycobacterium phage HINdeR]AGK87544.1 hypothetical protein PBI_HINDER_65 [Mycobacterium phage HINdeR]
MTGQVIVVAAVVVLTALALWLVRA